MLDLYQQVNTDKFTLHLVAHGSAESPEQLLDCERIYLAAGYEGMMVRSLDGPYKNGRSTEKQGYLLKVKRFTDSEAEIIGYTELMHNNNDAKVGVLGYIERSHKQEGLTPAGVLGTIVVKDVKSGVEFEIGTGFKMQEREQFWLHKDELIGLTVKYKYMEHGMKDKPRHPVFLGFRSQEDM